MRLSVGAVQMMAKLGDPEGNLERIGSLVREVTAMGARVVALPEAMNAGYLFDDRDHALACGELLGGTFVRGLERVADETGAWLACGITERDGDELYNSAILVGPERGLVAVHRKVNLAPHDRRWFSRGDGRPALADTPLGRLGLFICFDSRLPWVSRNLALGGADLLVNCANFFSEDKAALHLPVRAAENGIPVVAASKAGPERAATYQGGTCVLDADGQTLAVLGPEVPEGIIIADVELSVERRTQRLAGRRPNAYHVLDDPFPDTPAGRRAEAPVVIAETVVQVAAVQGRWADPSSLERRLAQVEALGAGIWVLPQSPCDDRPAEPATAERAADRSGAVLDAVARATRRAGAWCVLGTVVRDAGGPVAVHAIVNPEGEVRTSRRVHVDPATGWSPTTDEWTLAETQWGRIAVLGGADVVQPESGRCAALLGADLLCVTAAMDAAWVRDLAVLERSSETRCHVTMANRIDGCGAPGRSVVVPLTGFPTPKPLAVGRGVAQGPSVVTGFIELAAARNKLITTGTHLFSAQAPSPAVVS
ncbi:MAG: carbon-nitrogen hydrolase family protein [Acidimicrobiales bacterium]